MANYVRAPLLVVSLHNAQFFAFLCDEIMDVPNTEQLVFYVTFEHSRIVKECLIGAITLRTSPSTQNTF